MNECMSERIKSQVNEFTTSSWVDVRHHRQMLVLLEEVTNVVLYSQPADEANYQKTKPFVTAQV